MSNRRRPSRFPQATLQSSAARASTGIRPGSRRPRGGPRAVLPKFILRRRQRRLAAPPDRLTVAGRRSCKLLVVPVSRSHLTRRISAQQVGWRTSPYPAPLGGVETHSAEEKRLSNATHKPETHRGLLLIHDLSEATQNLEGAACLGTTTSWLVSAPYEVSQMLQNRNPTEGVHLQSREDLERAEQSTSHATCQV